MGESGCDLSYHDDVRGEVDEQVHKTDFRKKWPGRKYEHDCVSYHRSIWENVKLERIWSIKIPDLNKLDLNGKTNVREGWEKINSVGIGK